MKSNRDKRSALKWLALAAIVGSMGLGGCGWDEGKYGAFQKTFGVDSPEQFDLSNNACNTLLENVEGTEEYKKCDEFSDEVTIDDDSSDKSASSKIGKKTQCQNAVKLKFMAENEKCLRMDSAKFEILTIEDSKRESHTCVATDVDGKNICPSNNEKEKKELDFNMAYNYRQCPTGYKLSIIPEDAGNVYKCVKAVCGGTAVDIFSDSKNCGKCKEVCSPGDKCEGGICKTAGCRGGQLFCDSKCVDPMVDNMFCGAKNDCDSGNSCGIGDVCLDGKCVKNSCEVPKTLCSTTNGNKCINVKINDAENCGGCGFKCSDNPLQNATSSSCNMGECQYACSTGFVNVGNGITSKDINCIDPKTDSLYCGATDSNNGGEKCAIGKVCVDGKCVQNSCTAPMTLCATQDGNKCINVDGDNSEHCGACNYKCADNTIQDATPLGCSEGECQYKCLNELVNVGNGSAASKIKCINPKTDNNYCGAESAGSLGKSCTSGTVCVDGECVQNSCTVPMTLCATQNGNQCIDVKSNNSDHCGACNYRCADKTIQDANPLTCIDGECRYECSGNLVNVGEENSASKIKCINPKTDNNYCGAESASSLGKSCTSGTVCVDGKCVQNSCADTLTLCSVGGENQCINVNSNNVEHCGACNYKCSEHALAGATSNSCSGGECRYSCSDNLINVGEENSASKIKCIDPNTDNTYCGAKDAKNKGKHCTSGTVCVGGKCVQNSCSEKLTLCSIGGENQCIDVNGNDMSHCGACNYKCANTVNATASSCWKGQCQYTCSEKLVNVGIGNLISTIKCVDPNADNAYCGATSSSDKGDTCTNGTVCVNGECVQNSCADSLTLCSVKGENTCINTNESVEHCGGCNNKCSNNNPKNAKVSSCTSGKCHYSCLSNFVNVGGGTTATDIRCIDPATDKTHCGANATINGKDCSEQRNTPNAVEVACKDSECIAITCKTGYHIEGKQCVEDNDSNCGGMTCSGNTPKCDVSVAKCVECLVAKDCEKDGNAGVCQNDKTCYLTRCKQGHYFKDGKCEPNNDSNCGMEGKICEPKEGEKTSACKSGTNDCVATECKDGFYLDNGKCNANNDANCRGVGIACTKDKVSHASDVTCFNKANCEATACEEGFYLYEGKCKTNDNNNCGAVGRKCVSQEGEKTSVCNSGTNNCEATACEEGFYLYEGKCKANDNDNCGAKDEKCSGDEPFCAVTEATCVACLNAENCANAYGGVDGECIKGVCSFSQCQAGFYNENGECKPNDNENCGKKGETCTTGKIKNAIEVTCVGKTQCEVVKCGDGSGTIVSTSRDKCEICQNDKDCGSEYGICKDSKCKIDASLGLRLGNWQTVKYCWRDETGAQVRETVIKT